MPFYKDHVYPHLVHMLGDPKPIREVRERIIPLAEGQVLEIGVGPGVNFLHYDPGKVTKVYALEPNPGMIRLAEPQRRLTKLDIEFLDFPGERIPLQDGTVDAVVSTFTLCTIPGVVEALRGIGRVLRRSGKFIFFSNTGCRPILGCNAGNAGRSPFLTTCSKGVTLHGTFRLSSPRAGSRSSRWRRPTSPISEIVVVLLVGHGESSIRIAAVQPYALSKRHWEPSQG